MNFTNLAKLAAYGQKEEPWYPLLRWTIALQQPSAQDAYLVEGTTIA